MKKLNAKGFTLIELLAVITIMGILMIVAVPAVGRMIENTKRDSFLDTAKQYANGVKTLWISDSLECSKGSDYILASAVENGVYYVPIDTANAASYPVILESGGKSSWSSKDVRGYVKVNVTGAGTLSAKQTYHIALTDGTHGIKESDIGLEYLNLKRSNVAVSGATLITLPTGNGVCREV